MLGKVHLPVQLHQNCQPYLPSSPPHPKTLQHPVARNKLLQSCHDCHMTVITPTCRARAGISGVAPTDCGGSTSTMMIDTSSAIRRSFETICTSVLTACVGSLCRTDLAALLRNFNRHQITCGSRQGQQATQHVR